METTGRGPPGMVLVPSGPFLFGRDKRSVSIGAFWVDRDPVTNGEYETFVRASEHGRPAHWPAGQLPPELRDHPVVHVTFDDALAYARFVGKDLPTPAQWEKAARGTDGRKYPWGSTFEAHLANTKESARNRTVAGPSLRDESPWGCRGMGGNVLEWTRGVSDAVRGTRIVKGASFRTYLAALAWAHEAAPHERNEALGFRCVKAVAPAPSAVREAAPGQPPH